MALNPSQLESIANGLPDAGKEAADHLKDLYERLDRDEFAKRYREILDQADAQRDFVGKEGDINTALSMGMRKYEKQL